MSEATSTRDRIVREATRLFAAQGIKATTVAQIEVAVGLRKGSGGVHRYFATKNDLVHAALEAQLVGGQGTLREATAWPTPKPHEVRAFLETVGALALAHAERNREVALIMLRDAPSIDAEQLRQHRHDNDALAYGSTAAAVRELQQQLGTTFGVDANALGFVFMAPLVYFRLVEWASGERVLGIEDDELLATWATVFEPLFRQLAEANTRSGAEPSGER